MSSSVLEPASPSLLLWLEAFMKLDELQTGASQTVGGMGGNTDVI